jgi:hypothetical protein
MEVLQVSMIDDALSLVNTKPHIDRLPVELLQQIFLLVVHNMPDYPSIFSLECDSTLSHEYIVSANFSAPPLLFTRVCCLWRVVAHSTTGLWSRIQVMLPGGIKPLNPFLPSLLRFWLSRSRDQPLTLRIDSRPFVVKCGTRQRLQVSDGNSQLLEILLSERRRWESATFASSVREWQVKSDTLDTPRLRTLECYISDLKRCNAPNISHLHVRGFSYSGAVISEPTPTTTNIRHLHLEYASVHVIRSTASVFPHLQTLVVDRIFPGSESDLVTHSCRLEVQSMTLPISPYIDIPPGFVAIFRGLQLPMLQKLILVGELGKAQVSNVLAALAVASCHPRMVDFQPNEAIPLSEVDASIAEPLLSVVEEVTVHGELLCHRTRCH